VRRRPVDEWDGGWIPGLEWELGEHRLGLGGELRLHRSHHFGDVRSATVYPAELPQYQRFYDYRIRRNAASAYLRDRIEWQGGWAMDAALQLQRQSVVLFDDRRWEVGFEREYSFLSPRLGLSWRPRDGQSYFASAALGSRSPAHRDVYDAGDFWSGPGGEIYQDFWGVEGYVSHFRPEGDGIVYVGPEAKPEKVFDLELGGRIEASRFALDWTLYWMDFRDEIVPYAGALDDNQHPSNGNAERSRHMGLELGGRLRLAEGWSLSGAAHFTRDRFVRFTEYGYDWDEYEPVATVYDGQAIPGYPVYAWNLRLEGSAWRASPWLAARGAGRQWLDGDNNEYRSVEPYALMDAGMGWELGDLYRLRGLRLDLRVNNLLNTRYESAGYIDWDDLEPRWFVGAPRNVYASLSVDL